MAYQLDAYSPQKGLETRRKYTRIKLYQVMYMHSTLLFFSYEFTRQLPEFAYCARAHALPMGSSAAGDERATRIPVRGGWVGCCPS